MRKRIIPLILAVLCLVSMVAPMYTSAACEYCGGALKGLYCNDGYKYTYWYHNSSSVYCYETRNARCEIKCTACPKVTFVDHCHDTSTRVQHDYIIETSGIGGTVSRACDRIGCGYSEVIDIQEVIDDIQ